MTDGNPFIQDPVGYRAAMVSALQRRLFGPTSTDDQWITQKPSQKIASGSEFAAKRAVGPFVNAIGQEVLAVSPRSLYLTGVLWGTHTAVEDNEGDAEVDDPDDEDTPQRANRGRKRVQKPQAEQELSPPAEGETDLDDENLPDDIDQLGRRRSMAISFRAPAGVAEADVAITFGTYSELSARFDGKDTTLWERTAHRVSFTLPLSDSDHHEAASGQHTLRVGWRSRVDRIDGSRLVTVWFSNETGQGDVNSPVSGAMFQVEAEIIVPELLPYVNQHRIRDSLDLLYRHDVDLAIGHGTDVSVESEERGCVIRSAAIPVAEVPSMTPDVTTADGTSLGVGMADLGEFNQQATTAIERLIAEYEQWIGHRNAELTELDGESLDFATANIERCGAFLDDIKTGWQLVGHDPEVRQCLMDASSGMNQQRVGAGAARRPVELDDDVIDVRGTHPHASAVKQSAWRPFQIAFILASLPKIVDPEHNGRHNVDVIWMPTGGGKTEAYLGLAAFTILWERRQLTLDAPGTAKTQMRVLMRYTLRLLTVQQFLRSAALICALELIRRDHPDRYGTIEVRIGTWVGSSTTPNKREYAVKALRTAARRNEPTGFLLNQCPWCGAAMGHVLNETVVGYSVVEAGAKNVKRVLAACPDDTCPFSRRTELIGDVALNRGLPVFEVDEDVYMNPPDFVIGTIDKVAMMWDQSDAYRLFGLKNGKRVAGTRPPALFIQDELHLISGPLGSLDGAIEMMLEELCCADEGRSPLIVASTATTRNFDRQIDALYARSAALVPPPGLDISDSFFSVRDTTQPPRVYVGVCSSGGFTNAGVQLAVLATLAHFPPVIEDRMASGAPVSVDPYWTNVCFFSSRAALGSLTSLAENELRGQLNRLRQGSGSSSGSYGEDRERRSLRFVAPPREITATSSENVTVVLDDLSLPHDDPRCIDLCFATSMIEVGLDVGRLGLMTVIGQPKASSQYIQVTGRVGRSTGAPALVVDVLGTRTPRDRSHYEHFGSFHRRLYASVEGATVTPFTAPALERTAPTVAAILSRALGAGRNPQEQIVDYWPRLTEMFRSRARRVSGQRGENEVTKILALLLSSAQSPRVATFQWADRNSPDSSFLFAFGAAVNPQRPYDYWRVLTSVRTVDPDSVAVLHDPLLTEGGAPTTHSQQTDEEELL